VRTVAGIALTLLLLAAGFFAGGLTGRLFVTDRQGMAGGATVAIGVLAGLAAGGVLAVWLWPKVVRRAPRA
jgi:hypothetical protein